MTLMMAVEQISETLLFDQSLTYLTRHGTSLNVL